MSFRPILLSLSAVAILLGFGQPARAQSNKEDVQNDLRAKHEKPIFVTHESYMPRRERPGGESAVFPDGTVISLENLFLADRRIEKRFLDIDGPRKIIMPVQKFTKFGGCEWVLHDIGGGYFALQNRFLGTFLDVDGRQFGALRLADNHKAKGTAWKPFALPNGHVKWVNRHWTENKQEEIVLDIDYQGARGDTMPIVAKYSRFGGCDWKVEPH